MSSSTLVVIRLPRSSRWKVLAKRWASSRIRCSRYSASVWRGMWTGSDRPGTNTSSNRLASDATGISSSRPSSRTHPLGHGQLALAAVDQQQLRRVGEAPGPLARSPIGRSRSAR